MQTIFEKLGDTNRQEGVSTGTLVIKCLLHYLIAACQKIYRLNTVKKYQFE